MFISSAYYDKFNHGKYRQSWIIFWTLLLYKKRVQEVTKKSDIPCRIFGRLFNVTANLCVCTFQMISIILQLYQLHKASFFFFCAICSHNLCKLYTIFNILLLYENMQISKYSFFSFSLSPEKCCSKVACF